MMPRVTMAKGISLLTSAAIVGGGVWLAKPNLVIKMEGAGEAIDARMGTSFEDMVQGTLKAKTVENITPQPTQLDKVEPVDDAATTPQMDPVKVEKAEPKEVTSANVAQSSAKVEELEPTPQQKTATLAPKVAPQQAQLPITSPTGLDAVVSAAPVETVEPVDALGIVASTPIQPLRPAAVTPMLTETALPPLETLAAQVPDNTAPSQSMRPKRKNSEKAAEVAAARPKPKVAKAKPKVSRGNAQQSNAKGAESGNKAKAKATTQGTTKRASAQAGNAAASNYPGKVMRRISRMPKPRVKARGTALVVFSISSGGGLAGVSVARSSGSTALDQAAMQYIRKAAPFPPPPRGAQRRFSVQIKGR